MNQKTIGTTILLLLPTLLALSVPPPVENQSDKNIKSAFQLASTSYELSGKLVKQLGELNEGKNFVFSPISLTSILAMVYLGAGGETRQELSELMSIGEIFENDEELLQAVKATTEVFGAENQVNLTMSMVNKMLVAENFDIEPAYAEVSKSFGAEIESFVNNAESAAENAKSVNDWAAEQTNGRIKQIVNEDLFTPNLRLVLLNAVYFLAQWETPFNRFSTREGNWSLSSNETKPVNFMSVDHPAVGYYQHADAKFVQLDYVNTDYAMLLMLPKDEKDSFQPDTGVGKIAYQDWGEIFKAVDSSRDRIFVALPRFEIKQSIDMKSLMSSYGLSLFAPGANLTNISSKENLYVSSLLQKSFIRANEEGTEAAAVTIAGVTSYSTPSDYVTFDRPFLFLIRHKPTNSFLFSGRIADPEYEMSEEEIALQADIEAQKNAFSR